MLGNSGGGRVWWKVRVNFGRGVRWWWNWQKWRKMVKEFERIANI